MIERVGQIESSWSNNRAVSADEAGIDAFYRLELLQNALRRRLLDPRGKPFALNRSDPAHHQPDFFEIDAMIDTLWGESKASQKQSVAEAPVSNAISKHNLAVDRPKRVARKQSGAKSSRPCSDQQLLFPGFAADFPLHQKPISSNSAPAK